MSDELQDITLIEAYLNEELDAQQRQAVETRRDNDPAFAQLLIDLEILFEGSREAYRQDIESQLQDIESDLPPIEIDEAALLLDDIPKPKEPKIEKPKPEDRKMRIGKWWRVAAVLIPLLGIMTWMLWPKPSVEERLFAAYFELPALVNNPTRGIGDNKIKALGKKADMAYNSNDCTIATSAYEELYTVHRDTQSLFYLGISQLCEGQTDEAIKNLKTFDQVSEDIRFNQNDFYIALAYLRQGQTEEALKLLAKENSIEARKLSNEITSYFNQ